MTSAIVAVLNTEGGTLRTLDVDALCDQLTEAFEGAGHTLDIVRTTGSDLIATLEEALGRSDIDILLVAGGDGTVSAGAAHAWKAGKALALLPAGTMNLFARAAGIPLDMDEAIEALADGEIRDCDIATVNGRAFIHQFAVGIHPRAMKLRNQLDYDSRYGKMLASARAFISVINKPLTFKVSMIIDGIRNRKRLTALSVSNNRLGSGHLPYPDRLDEGVLGIYWSRAETLVSNLRLVAATVRGTWRSHEHVQEATGKSVSLQFLKRRRNANAIIDGEVVPLEGELDIEIHPGELRVLLPRNTSATADPNDEPSD